MICRMERFLYGDYSERDDYYGRETYEILKELRALRAQNCRTEQHMQEFMRGISYIVANNNYSSFMNNVVNTL